MKKQTIKKEEEILDTTVDVTEKIQNEISSVSVITKDKQVLRTYTKEIHGKDFIKLAKEFADKKGLSLK